MTEFFQGQREKVSWVEETSFGSGGTMSSGHVVGKNVTITPKFTKGWQETLQAGGDTRGVTEFVKGPHSLNYTMNFLPTDWRWMKYLMTVADGTDDTVKTHTFTLANTIDSYKLEWAKQATTDLVYTIVGNVVKKATISFRKTSGEGSEGFINVNLECLAKSQSDGSSTTATAAITVTPFQYRSTILNINGSEITELNNGEMTIDAGIDEDDSRYCNATLDQAIGEPIPKTFRISGRFNVNVSDKTYQDLWDAETAVSGACTLIFSKGADDRMTYTFTNFTIKEAIAPSTLDGVTNVDLIWVATAVSAVTRDAIATYE